MSKFGDKLIESLKQASAHARGRRVPGIRMTTVKFPKPRRGRGAPRVIPGRGRSPRAWNP